MAEQNRTADEWKASGNKKYQAGDYHEAIKDYSEAIKLAPETPAYYGNRSAAYVMINQHQSAIDDCERALTLDKNFMKVYPRLSKAYMTIGNLQASAFVYSRALLTDPNNTGFIQEKRNVDRVAANIKRANELADKGSFRQALTLLGTIMPSCAAYRDLQILQARCMVEANRLEQATEALLKLMKGDGASHPEVLYWRARLLYKQENFPASVKHLQQALRSDPDNKKCMVEIKRMRALEAKKTEGNTAFKNGQWASAVALYTECLALDPKFASFNAKLFCNRAAARLKLKEYEAAEADCTSAIAADKEYTKAYMRRAEARKGLGTLEALEGAVFDLEEAQRKMPRERHREMAASIRDAKAAVKVAKRKDYYKILGVDRSADEGAIKKAYKRAALKCHPDRFAGKSEEEKAKAVKMFQDVTEANEVLSDPAKKRRYDGGADIDELDHDPSPFGHGGHGGHGGMDPNDIFSMFFGGGGGAGHSMHFG